MGSTTRRSRHEKARAGEARETFPETEPGSVKALQKALFESEDRFCTAFVNAPIGMAICSPIGDYVQANQAFAAMLGYTEKELQEQGIRSVTHPDDVATNFEQIEKLIAGESSAVNVEKRYVRKDGTVIWAEATIALTRDLEGLPRHLIVQARDVTARRAAEDGLRRAQRHLSEAERIGGLGSWEWDIKNDRVTWSEEMYRILGMPPRTFGATAQSYLALVHPDDRAFVQQDIERSLRDHVPFLHENRIVRHDGTVRTLSSRGEVKFDGSGTPTHMLGVCRDVTEQRRAEEALRQSEQNLERRVAERTRALSEANQELDAFVHSVGHDLRAPLRAITYYCEALESDVGQGLGQEGKGHVERILHETRRISALTSDLLTLARTTSSDIVRTPVDLSEIARLVVNELRREEPQRSVDVTIRPGVTAAGDASLLAVVMQNLLSNAWKFTRPKRDARIEFGVDQDDGKLTYFVRDNGVGFSMSQATRLFQPFQRLHSRDQFEGTGIGLSTVNRIIMRHGGKVWAEGQPGEGATFFFTL